MTASAPPQRLAIIPGLWQLLMLEAALRCEDADASDARPTTQDTLVFIGGRIPPPMRELLERVTPRLRPWRSVVWAEDLAPLDGPRDIPSVDQFKQAFERRTGLDRVDEVWVGHLLTRGVKLSLEAYPKARLCLYEDGLHTYCGGLEAHRPPTATRRLARQALLPLSPKRRACASGVVASHVRRLDHARLFLSDTLPLPDALRPDLVRSIPAQQLRATLREARDHAGTTQPTPLASTEPSVGTPLASQAPIAPSSTPGDSSVLMLGQCFALGGLLTEDAEWALYRDAVARIIAAGQCVWWKDHPRLAEGYGARLIDAFGPDAVGLHHTPAGWPVEWAFLDQAATACAGCTTSSLLYLRQLFGTRCFTYADRVAQHFKPGSSFHRMTELVIQAVPSLDTFTAPLDT